VPHNLSVRVVPLLVSCVWLSSIVWAQTGSGTIRGTVTDPSGAAVPVAKVTVLNTATNGPNTRE
jgi:hypothetical protein